MSGHTPGPWQIVERSDTLNIKAGRRCIARLQIKAGAWSDARFIVGAVDVVDAAQELLRWDSLHFNQSAPVTEAVRNLRQAIHRATEGEK